VPLKVVCFGGSVSRSHAVLVTALEGAAEADAEAKLLDIREL
jgi:hypothetical protein